MKTKEKKEGSFGNTIKKGNFVQEKKEIAEFSKKRANHYASWIAGIIFSLIPIITCKIISCTLYNDNSILLNKYQEFIADFFNSGSFLWLSITVLVMSLLDLLLYGEREIKSEKTQFIIIIFVLLCVVFVFIGISIYILNIQNSINEVLMYNLSWGAFILFCITSGIINFKILKEA